MIKFKYTWAFVVAVLGNILFWIEALYEPLESLVRAIEGKKFVSPAFYKWGGALLLFSWGLLALNQLWLSRFKGGQHVALTCLCIGIPGFFICMEIKSAVGTVRENDLLIYLLSWLSLCLIFYTIRAFKKPVYLKSPLSTLKHMCVIGILLGGIIVALQLIFNIFSFLIPNAEFYMVIIYAIGLQVGLPLSMLLHVIDLHKRDKLVAGEREKKMIDLLGQ